MSECRRCGRRCIGRLCRDCKADERAAERAEYRRDEQPECPSCGRVTSGEGVECYRCRDSERAETDGGREVFIKADDGGLRAETCPNCGGSLRYVVPDIGALECDGCRSEYQHGTGGDREFLVDENGEEAASARPDELATDGGREECPRCGYLLENTEAPCPYCGADPDEADDGDALRPDGGSIRGLDAGDDIERHLQAVLENADDREARRHAREALQHTDRLEREGRR
ncbi:hypothetical protein ACOZ4L_02660 [Haloplanus ruber]|uniref:Zinc ribbon domain-containing protein n=1 Tax=Haloplanus ruber TaxID=869892 RepID=A0ABD6D1Z0_9EURY|nr:hypothetical protein [Haloplanus ruber]